MGRWEQHLFVFFIVVPKTYPTKPTLRSKGFWAIVVRYSPSWWARGSGRNGSQLIWSSVRKRREMSPGAQLTFSVYFSKSGPWGGATYM